jgi:HlyD family secretion protein
LELISKNFINVKTIYIIVGGAVVLIVALIALSKAGIIGRKIKELRLKQRKMTTIVETVSATGKIQPEIEVKISSMVSGEIIALPVKEGQVVRRGDLLVKITRFVYFSLNRTIAGLSGSKAGLTQADAQYKEAKSSYDRNKSLFEKV